MFVLFILQVKELETCFCTQGYHSQFSVKYGEYGNILTIAVPFRIVADHILK